jgi:hypothetical protein
MESTRIKLSAENQAFLETERISKKWTIDEDDSWWWDLFNSSLKEKMEFDELVEKINEDIKEELTVEEIYKKYEKFS